MASPALLANISLGSQIFGGIQGAAGAYYGAASEKVNLKAQAAIAETNAKIAEIGAETALAQGAAQIAQQTMEAGHIKSRQRANLAAAGVDLKVGSAAETQATTDIMKEIDKNTLHANAVKNAWGYRTQAVDYRNQALMARATAKGISPSKAMFSSILGSAGRVAGSWYSFNKSGAWDKPSGHSTGGMTGAVKGQGMPIPRIPDEIESMGATRGWWGVRGF
ncbi:MAG: hypothetical protein LBE24_04005 [Methylobacillus sp.]|jgi:hypothetical protein|nr:hypothetical protein [Methylobacillus sp.]